MFDREEYEREQREYLEDNGSLFVEYNPHPKGCKVGDCVKRAITKASGMDYMEVQRELNRYKKITGCSKFNENKNWENYITKELKMKKISGFHRMKIGEFCKTEEGKNGTYVIGCRKHLVTVSNGKVYDTWNCSFKAIGKVFKVF